VKDVQFHPAAQRELERAADWYERERTGLGREFRTDFEAALARMTQNPQAYAKEIGQYRACPLHRFSYTIFYADQDDRIWLVAVAHQSRRPGYWKRRRPS
jgi:plasmid stabilization system protein ParE